ncbi:hypothetical protein [Spirosoma rhododendri]|uniref:HEPN domain-containing protein n=1 Tax=Spirosoma rhododendri TaxID=2728024 RepID=A0A7L5DSQ0_9BACT|nr:hypothetical protein [Spirosoma rhododendri]QJD80293.1 hypothetical protein HH216_19095 [Spirosoma rhododendri]
MEHKTKIWQAHTEKLISNARAILTNQIALPLGIHKMMKQLYWIEQIGPLPIDVSLLREYYQQIQDYPLGTDRLLWNPSKLIELDSAMELITQQYRAKLLWKCLEIISLETQI